MSDEAKELEEARAEIARLKDQASQLRRRAPTREEADEAERMSRVPGTCLVAAGYWRGRRCPSCSVWVWRGREWCEGCEARHEAAGWV